jgi:hypothetical protein
LWFYATVASRGLNLALRGQAIKLSLGGDGATRPHERGGKYPFNDKKDGGSCAAAQRVGSRARAIGSGLGLQMGGKGRHVDDAGGQEPPPPPEGLGQREPRRPSMRGGGPLLGVSGPPRKPSGGMRGDRGAAQANSQGLRARAIGRAALGGREAGRGLGAGSAPSQLDQVVAEIERRALVRDAALVAAEERAVREASLREFDAIESAQRAAQAEQVPPPPLCAAVLPATQEAPLRPKRLRCDRRGWLWLRCRACFPGRAVSNLRGPFPGRQ